MNWCACKLAKKLRVFHQDQHGLTAAITAVVIFVIIGAAALSVDSSMFFMKRLHLQTAVDLASIAAVTNIANANVMAQNSLVANGITAVASTVTPGAYTPNVSLSANARFVANASPTNAVSVKATIQVPMFLGTIFHSNGTGSSAGTVLISASGRAAAVPIAAFAIGSRLASLNGGVANAVLSALTGATISLTAVDYNSLASTQLNLGTFMQALSATVAGTNGGTYASLLGMNVSLRTLLGALQSMGLNAQTTAAIGSLLNALPTSTGGIPLASLVDFGPYNSLPLTSPVPATVTSTVYDLLSNAIALAANGRQVNIGLGAIIPGVLGAQLSIAIGASPPSVVIAPFATTTSARTRQIRIMLLTYVSIPLLATIQLPVVLDVAQAVATTTGPTCSNGVGNLSLAVTPAAVDLTIGSTTALQVPPAPIVTTPAPIITILGLTIAASAHAAITNSAPVTQTYTTQDVALGTVKTTSVSNPIGSLLTTALSGVRLSIGGINASLLLPPLTLTSVVSGLNGLVSPTSSLLDSVVGSLGVGLGQADTWVTDLRCGSPLLVQ